MKIDTSKPILVTGANGYVASWLVKKLLEEGLTIHAAVRNPDDDEKVGHLKKLAENSTGILKFFKTDLLKLDAYLEAMQDCELVYHTASPFIAAVKNPEEELIKPAVLGTENVLNCVNKTPSVKRVVVTSSCAAMYTDALDTTNNSNGMLTEESWNTTASLDYQPYYLSKTLAEKKAWEMADAQNRWDLVTINMSLVLGPPLNPNHTTSESMTILKQFGDGTMKFGTPKLGMGLVDIRDVATAHFKAGFTPEAKGRYITNAHNTDILEMGLALQERYGGKYPIPKKALPKWLTLLVGPMMNKMLSRRFISNNVNVPFKADNSKIKKDFGIEFRSIKETMEDSFQSLIDNGII